MMTVATLRHKELEAFPPCTCKAEVEVTSLQLAFYREFVRTPVLKRPATAVVIACDHQEKAPHFRLGLLQLALRHRIITRHNAV